MAKPKSEKQDYFIECTVSELTKKKTKIAVKISGAEGYAIKQGDKTYNVFRPKDLPKAKKTVQSYIADSENEFTVDNNFENILTQATVHGKKIRLTVSESVLKNAKGKTSLPIKSVSLLQK